jgi:DNA repair exonuclease SbcCD ATPase subunit
VSFRHIYRKENSWLELASREEEFLRQAVVSFFLGIAEARYSSLEFDVGEAERRVLLLEDRLRQATDESDRLLEEITHMAGLPASQAADLDELFAELAGDLQNRQSQRREVLSTIESNPSFLEEPGDRYKLLDAQLHEGTLRAASMTSTIDAYRQAIQEISAQEERLVRAKGSIELLSEIPVKSCPACGQLLAARNEADSADACYVCGQDVGPDVRERRIDLELNALARERSEIGESIGRAERELLALNSTLETFADEREILRLRLDRDRAELIAPYLTQLESLNQSIGTLTQQMATVNALRAISSRRDKTADELGIARSVLEDTQIAARRIESSRRVAAERCSLFANAMTDFLRKLRVERWGFGDVTLAEADMTFYVAARHWDVLLGAEARALFLIAYHAALLQLPEGGEAGQPHGPGLAILDNPMQQGVPAPVIREALEQLLAIARQQGGQVLLTLPQDLELSEISVLRMTKQYSE